MREFIQFLCMLIGSCEPAPADMQELGSVRVYYLGGPIQPDGPAYFECGQSMRIGNIHLLMPWFIPRSGGMRSEEFLDMTIKSNVIVAPKSTTPLEGPGRCHQDDLSEDVYCVVDSTPKDCLAAEKLIAGYFRGSE